MIILVGGCRGLFRSSHDARRVLRGRAKSPALSAPERGDRRIGDQRGRRSRGGDTSRAIARLNGGQTELIDPSHRVPRLLRRELVHRQSEQRVQQLLPLALQRFVRRVPAVSYQEQHELSNGLVLVHLFHHPHQRVRARGVQFAEQSLRDFVLRPVRFTLARSPRVR